MNPMILELISSLTNYETDHPNKALNSVKGNDNLFSGILKSISSVPGKSSRGTDEPLRDGPASDKDGYHLYLESFQKALLTRGKQLNKVSLKQKDLPLMHTFLVHCGFSQKDVDRFLKELVEKNPGEGINLAQFFQKITELVSSKSKRRQSGFWEPSAIPHIESILRNFGMTPQASDGVIGAAKVADGRLAPAKLVAELKHISPSLKKETSSAAVQKLDNQLKDKLMSLGIPVPENKDSGRISLKDFITSLEQMIGKSAAEKKLPPKVQNAMNQIVAKVVVSGENTKTLVSVPLEQKALLSSLKQKSKPAAEDMQSAPFREQDKSVNRKSLRSALKDKAKPESSERSSVFEKEKGSINVDSGQLSAEFNNPTGKDGLVPELKGGPNFKQLIKENGYDFKSEAKAVNIFQQHSGSTLSEAVHSAKQHAKPFQDYLPGYLVDQVGRQISKAMLRGDQVIRLQLKPPELGALKIEMNIKDNTLRLEMFAEKSTTKELLLSNVHELREALRGQDVKLEKVDVQIDYNFGRSMQHSNAGLKEGQGWNQDFNATGLPVENHAGSSQPEPQQIRTRNQLLDLIA
uniref:Flagellar hook-length control protein FliK n=1 Tax=Candidatus Desulfatibia profunda TaxID=2841695 RepID=A0A8J6TH42_9BACT|nr:flagellar hook-length control protein FliK [Candidatus Desulfatibia profunda]